MEWATCMPFHRECEAAAVAWRHADECTTFLAEDLTVDAIRLSLDAAAVVAATTETLVDRPTALPFPTDHLNLTEDAPSQANFLAVATMVVVIGIGSRKATITAAATESALNGVNVLSVRNARNAPSVRNALIAVNARTEANAPKELSARSELNAPSELNARNELSARNVERIKVRKAMNSSSRHALIAPSELLNALSRVPIEPQSELNNLSRRSSSSRPNNALSVLPSSALTALGVAMTVTLARSELVWFTH